MPGSDEFFGIKENLSAMSDTLPPGMFPDMAAGVPGVEPSPDEMEKAAEAVRFSKIVKVKEFHVDTFDLSDPADKARYRAEVVKLYIATASKSGLLSHLEKSLRVVEGKPKMLVHMEWYEYELKITDHMIKKGASNEKKGRGKQKVVHSPA